jgi:DNA processing protein
MAPDVKTGQQPPTEAGQVLLEAMGFDPVDMDMLVQRTAMSVNTLTQELLLLELEGAIAVGQGIYQRLR